MGSDNLDHEILFFDWGCHIPTRSLYLEQDHDGEIGHETTAKFIKGLHVLERLSDSAITLYVSSPGGSVVAGQAIYDAIKQSPCPVTCYIYGEASSMASVVIQACRWRVASPNTELTLHDGTDNIAGNARDVIKQAEALKRACERSYDIYASRSTEGKDFFRRKLVTDFIITAEQALDLGLIDEIR